MAVWSTIFIEVWKRREYEIAHMWNVSDYKGEDVQRAEFKADYIIDNEERTIKKSNITNTYLRRITGELPSIIVSIAAVVGCFIGYYKFQTDNQDNVNYSVGSSVINAVVIIVLGIIYKFIANFLVDWENH